MFIDYSNDYEGMITRGGCSDDYERRYSNDYEGGYSNDYKGGYSNDYVGKVL